MRLIGIILVVAAAACSGSTATDSSTSSAEQTAACRYPPNVNSYDDASNSGCRAEPSAMSCTVSNGATVLADGGVLGGTETCKPICGASRYELACRNSGLPGTSSSIPEPAPSLNCTIITEPTPSNELFYCCPCAN